MISREESLKRILEATGVAPMLGDDERREIVGHLEDSIDAKVRAGAGELEAAGQAFAETGRLREIARQFLVLPSTEALAAAGFVALAVFSAIQLFVTPCLARHFTAAGLKELPLPTAAMVGLSGWMAAAWPLTLLALAGGAAALRRLARGRPRRALMAALLATSAVLLVACLVSLTVPFARVQVVLNP